MATPSTPAAGPAPAAGRETESRLFSPRQRGVLRALARFRIRRRLMQQRRVINFLWETGLLCVVASVFTQFLFMLLVQRYVDLNMHILLEFYALVAGTLLGCLSASIVFAVRLCIRRWPLPAQVEGPPLSIEEIEERASSGDIILFSYPIQLSGIFSGHFIDIVETLLLKLQGKIQWTHVTIVLEDESKTKWLAESTTDGESTGHSGPGMCLLRERLARSADYDLIAWRQLHWDPDMPPAERKANERRALEWVRALCCKQPAAYRLDFFRGLGKIMWDFGFTNAGAVMLTSGFDWDYDCAMFVGAVLRMLHVIERGEAMLRIFTVAHFAVERKESAYAIDTMRNMSWGPQRLINVRGGPREKTGVRHPE